MRGSVVISNAGRDKGRLQVITDEAEKTVSVCDGGEHPLERPKKKNLKHISFTAYTLGENQLETNKRLRRALKELCGKDTEEEK